MAVAQKVYVLQLTEQEIKDLKIDLTNVHESVGETMEVFALEEGSLALMRAIEELI